MTTPTLKLELTVAEIDMAFVLFQAARQATYTYEEVNLLMRKIQDQGRPQLEALALKQETPPPAPKVRKPREPKVVPATPVDAGLPDLSDLKLD
jgi:hypothetical protein